MKKISAQQYIDGILEGNRTLLSRAITLVESTKNEHREIAQQIIEGCLPHSGNSIRIGITGVPGVGKSTFIEAFGMYAIKEQQKKVAVLAVDPSSQRSKGSILGDKTRMERLSNEENAYIRPTPSAGSLGGVARNTRETILLCEAAGFDILLIETVGVGQSEIAVHSMVDFFLLLMLAGAGDELQGIKRGIMEMADAIAINKADSGNEQAAKRAMLEYKNALRLFPPAATGWRPKVTRCSALNNEGIDKVWDIVQKYINRTIEHGYFEQKRNDQSIYWLKEHISEALHHNFYSKPGIEERINEFQKKILSGEMTSYKAAQMLVGD